MNGTTPSSISHADTFTDAVTGGAHGPAPHPALRIFPRGEYHPLVPILGHGIDIVEIARIDAMLREHPERFLERVFTPSERAYAEANPRRRAEHLAARFAGKEAAFKALGTGWADGISWTEAEVVREASGAPTLVAHGRFAALAAHRGIARFWLSLSHTETHAVASVIASSEA